MQLQLHEKQSLAFASPAREILYGGAAGGGKSHFLRVLAIAACVAVPGVQVYLFRRTHPELFRNHMVAETGFPTMLADWVNSKFVSINYGDMRIKFHHPGHADSEIHLSHCEHEKDRLKYHGAEIHLLLMDELTHFSDTQYRYLRSRVRRGSLYVPPEWEHRVPGIVSGSNPGGAGHNWVKGGWIDTAAPYRTWQAAKSEGGMLRQFIPARLVDNPTMTDNDPDYEDRLLGLDDPELVRAMLEGDWNINAGGMFDDLLDPAGKQRIVMEPFPIPPNWQVKRVHDWGDTSPFCTLIMAESNGEEVTLATGEKRTFVRGSIIVIGEDYGWTGKADTGLGLSSAQIARRVLKLQDDLRAGRIIGRDHQVHAGPGDIPDKADGHSPRDEYARIGVRFVAPDKTRGSRAAGWATMRSMLAAARSGSTEDAGLFIFDSCTNLLRTMHGAPRGERDRTDLADKYEDHALDACRYGVSSRHGRVQRLELKYG